MTFCHSPFATVQGVSERLRPERVRDRLTNLSDTLLTAPDSQVREAVSQYQQTRQNSIRIRKV